MAAIVSTSANMLPVYTNFVRKALFATNFSFMEITCQR